MSLPYTLIIKEIHDESGKYFYGTYAELDGCQSTGDDVAELLENMNEARSGWLEVKLEHGDPIPEPKDDYSGKILLRIPKSLHQQLAVKADLEGISLNQYMLYKLSK
ncbi:toxin-antitoxin system HicB family antitoxin [Paenibacillus pinihumi]|uniref:toxin-antitoxin system HicB family antitoxin n=1 Tax=Paenibacillus pinihumi TaxID=669462 RepID=UPI000421308B|nr:toxin-antitoxin system HicB family antitoxin [Paenibacillus pinihumi]